MKTMKLNLKFLNLTIICLSLLTSCNDNNESINEPETETFLYCGENPFINQNINNLDQTAGEIKVFPLLTANGDNNNDYFSVENLEQYSFNSVTLYDLNNNIVFSTENYGGTNLYGGNLNIEDGSLKYKVVVQNEQTFVEYGYVCIVTGIGEGDNNFSFFSECSLGAGFFDQIIAN